MPELDLFDLLREKFETEIENFEKNNDVFKNWTESEKEKLLFDFINDDLEQCLYDYVCRKQDA